LISIENDIELFESLLLSYSDRLKAVIEAEGSHTDYWNNFFKCIFQRRI
jgi:hypothetical protein